MAAESNTVSLRTDLNVSPFYDDFREDKNFYRILFRPGMAVQARELTQLQTGLQNQIDRFAENVFREGARVRGCEINYDQRYYYVKLRDLSSTGAAVNAHSFIGRKVTGATSGVAAVVVGAAAGAEANTPNFKTLFVKYTGASGTVRFFANNEILSSSTGSLYANTIKSTQGAATGHGSAITIGSGVVFAKDHFVRVGEQTLVLARYSANTTYRVGIQFDESIVTESGDTTLLDPASGSYNYAAPGAARLKIAATLAKRTLAETGANSFVEMLQIKDGMIQTPSDVAPYSAIRDYMAKRTYEESGDFTISGLSVRLSEHLRSGNNQGLLSSARGGNTSLLAASIEPGKAYINGYDVERVVTGSVPLHKGIDYVDVQSAASKADYGNYVTVDNVVGNWDVNYQGSVTLRDTQANACSTKSYSLTSFPGASIGTARVRGIEYHSGVPGSPSAQYKVYLGDIRITTAGKSFANVQCIAYNGGAGSANGKADILGTSGSTAATVDSSFDRAVWRLPSTSTRRVRDSAGAVALGYDFYKSFPITFNSSGAATVSTGASDETFDGAGAMSSTLARGVYLVARASANTAVLTGTVSITGNTVTGSGSAFTTQVNVGDLLAIANSGDYVVSQVVSATSLKTLAAAASAKTGMPYYKKFKPGQALDLGGVGADGARSATVSSSTTLALDLNETLNSPSTMTATAVVKLNKVDAQEATKAVSRSRLIQVRIGAGGGSSYVANTTGPWPLGLSDGFKLVTVRRKVGSNFSATSDGADVTAQFTLDTGMRDGYYDHAQLRKRPGSSLSIASGDRLLVTLDHFTHTHGAPGIGFFTVDSYPVNDSTAGSDTSKIYTYQIPVYVSPRTGARLDLRDSIDFRPRVADTANSVTALTNISINPLTSTTLDQPSGCLHFPIVEADIESDLSYYLPRRDLIVMTKNGGLQNIRGVSAASPVTPDVPRDVMALARIEIAPYPSLPDESARRAGRPDMGCAVIPIRNERYTMRDIGALRDRIDRVEYYTSLTMLEKSAQSLNIQDANGLDRFKNGIVVDSFIGHNIGNVYDPDYKISIDAQRGEMRPPFRLDSVEMFYMAANSSGVVRANHTTAGVARDQIIRISNTQVAFSNSEVLTSGAYTATLNYKVGHKLYITGATGNFAASATVTGGTSGGSSTIVTAAAATPVGDLVTLPYSHLAAVTQPYGTTSRQVAGLAYNWAGVLELVPDGDYWQDTTRLPDVQINFDFGADNWLAMQSAWGTQWNDWQTISTGESEVNSREVVTGTSVQGSQLVENTQSERTIQTTENQSRSGSRLTVVPVTKQERTGTRVRDANIIPFMRSQVIRFTGRGLKPGATLYGYFDNIKVSSYIARADSSFANTSNEGAALTVGSDGVVRGLFRIPAEASLRFRTGQKVFRLTDNPNNASGLGLATTAAEALYTAQGLNVQQQDTLITTRSAQVTSDSVSDSRTTTSSRTDTSTGGTRVVGSLAPVPGVPSVVSPNPTPAVLPLPPAPSPVQDGEVGRTPDPGHDPNGDNRD